MKNEKGNFRGRLFGGFNRKDVISYIGELADERNALKAENERLRDEIEKLETAPRIAQEETDAMRASAEREIETGRAALEREETERRAALETEISDARAALQKEVDETRTALQRETEEQRAAWESELAEARAALLREQDEQRGRLAREADEQRSVLEKEREELLKLRETALRDVRGAVAAVAEEYNALRADTERDASRLRGELGSTADSVARLSSVISAGGEKLAAILGAIPAPAEGEVDA